MSRILLFLLLFLPFQGIAEDWKAQFITHLKNGGVLVVDSQDKVVLSHRADELFIPASIMKVATSYCALSDVGPDFKFTTRFYESNNNELIVQGFGDPNLISEELAIIAKELVKIRNSFNGIILDTSFFDSAISIDGTSNSLNPYDAPNGALLANFHTAFLEKTKAGRIVSAEPQTPLTPLSIRAGKNIKKGRERINLGKDSSSGAKYLGELLKAFIEIEGGTIAGKISIQSTPKDSHFIYEHKSEKTLADVIKGLLEFSTNFTANQVMLVLGAKKYGAPANLAKGEKWLRSCLAERLKWRISQVEEGSGLSRKNLIAPSEFITLLKAFLPYSNLLKQEGSFLAKTGTLTGVNSYAGYFFSQKGERFIFVYMVNSVVPYDYKFKLAKELLGNIS